MHIGMWRRRLSLLVVAKKKQTKRNDIVGSTKSEQTLISIITHVGLLEARACCMLHAYQDLLITKEVVSSAVSGLVFVRFSVIKWRV